MASPDMGILPYSANFVILGDSFVSRLEGSLHHVFAKSPAAKVMSFNAYCRDALKAPTEVNNIYFNGWGGSGLTHTAQKRFTLPHSLLISKAPKYAILEIGGNDVDSSASVDSIVKSRIEMANQLINIYDMYMVALCSILPRDSVRNYTPVEFRERALAVNIATSDQLKSLPSIYFHKHKGFWRDSGNNEISTLEWSNDGVHPNEIGMATYQKSITRCIHHLTKAYRNPPRN